MHDYTIMLEFVSLYISSKSGSTDNFSILMNQPITCKKIKKKKEYVRQDTLIFVIIHDIKSKRFITSLCFKEEDVTKGAGNNKWIGSNEWQMTTFLFSFLSLFYFEWSMFPMFPLSVYAPLLDSNLNELKISFPLPSNLMSILNQRSF